MIVRCGSIASIPGCPRYVRLCSKSGAKGDMKTLRIRANTRIVTYLALVGEGHVYHQLALGRMTRDVSFARRILRHHDAPRG